MKIFCKFTENSIIETSNYNESTKWCEIKWFQFKDENIHIATWKLLTLHFNKRSFHFVMMCVCKYIKEFPFSICFCSHSLSFAPVFMEVCFSHSSPWASLKIFLISKFFFVLNCRHKIKINAVNFHQQTLILLSVVWIIFFSGHTIHTCFPHTFTSWI